MQKLNYDDIVVVPEKVSRIKSRKECNPFDENGMLPIWAAPMDTVINLENWKLFNKAGINVIIPRTVSLEDRLDMLFNFAKVSASQAPFVAFSLNEAEQIPYRKRFKDFIKTYNETSDCGWALRICIDMANGHMSALINVIKELKKSYGSAVTIMSGNIANPETYVEYENAGCDYLRAGIGGGSACLTSSSCSVHYPYFSLIKEIYEIKKKINGKCKVIADGNIKNFGDIQKALVYADYVMIGGLFNKAIESAGKTTYGNRYFNIRGKKIFRPLTTLFTYGRVIPAEKYDKAIKLVKENKLTIWKEFYGMSTKRAQQKILEGNGKPVEKDKLKTAEGIVSYQKVEYSIFGWVKNEIDYLRSAMSYTDSFNLDEYKESQWVSTNQLKYNK